MANQILIDQYNRIEKQRVSLKNEWAKLKKSKGDAEEIRKLGSELTKLTLNQAHILINLERDENEV